MSNIEEKEVKRRQYDFRKRSYALLKLQSSVEGKSMVDILEKALENYADESIKMIIDSKFGEYTERPKKGGKKPKAQTTELEPVVEEVVKKPEPKPEPEPEPELEPKSKPVVEEVVKEAEPKPQPKPEPKPESEKNSYEHVDKETLNCYL